MGITKIIQVTDTHLVGGGGRLKGLDPRERLDACIAAINAHQQDAHLCIFTGDITDKGSPIGYDDFKQAVSRLELDFHLMIGNHDNRDVFLEAFPETSRDPDGFVQKIVETDAGLLVLLDTQASRISEGGYCERRADWLAATLAGAGGAPIYLFMHHPPFDIGMPSMDRIRLLDTGAFERAIEGHDIRHIFLGHVHRPISGSWKGIAYSIGPGTNHQVAFDFETLKPVPHSHEPPGYGMILISGDTVAVHYHNYLDNSELPGTVDALRI